MSRAGEQNLFIISLNCLDPQGFIDTGQELASLFNYGYIIIYCMMTPFFFKDFANRVVQSGC